MHITFVCESPMDQKNEFSGVPYYMSRAIQAQAGQFEFVQTPKYNSELVLYGNKNQARGEFIRSGQYLSERLRDIVTDVVICSTASMIPYLETEIPVILWHDSTWFSCYSHSLDFESFKTKHPLLYELDQRTLQKCTLVAFAADWIRDETLQYYDLSPEKAHVIPFGANIDSHQTKDIENLISRRKNDVCILSFIGKEWERKGLPLAYEVTHRLNDMKVNTILKVMGCSVNPPRLKRKISNAIHYHPYSHAEQFEILFNKSLHVEKIGFLDKNDPSEFNQFAEELSSSHFLIHPASFEPFGIVMAEANAYGVPVIATRQYGPKTVVRDGINGYLFAQDEFVEKASSYIANQMSNYESYLGLAQSSYTEFRSRLNWETSVKALLTLIVKMLLTGA